MENFCELLNMDPGREYTDEEFSQILAEYSKLWESEKNHPSPQHRNTAITNLSNIEEIKNSFYKSKIRKKSRINTLTAASVPDSQIHASTYSDPSSSNEATQHPDKGSNKTVISPRLAAHIESFELEEPHIVVCHYCKNTQDVLFDPSGTIMVECENCHRSFEAHLLKVNARPEIVDRIPFVGTLSVKSPESYTQDIYIRINHNNMRYKVLLERLRAEHRICITGTLDKPLNLIDYDSSPMYEAELNNGAANKKGACSTFYILLVVFLCLFIIVGTIIVGSR